VAAQLSRLADFMPYRLSITTNAVSHLIAGKYRARFGLKVPEWRVMAVLGDAGSATQRELVQAIRMDKVAVNRACKALEQRGLVVRSPNAADGRSHHLELSSAGAEVYGQIMPLALQMEREVFACLTEREARQFKIVLGKLLERAETLSGERE
jgi:DNA-binding MarR family transcriptional regulator